MDKVQISESDYNELKDLYQEGKEKGTDKVVWNNRPLLLDYLKYMLEYMELENPTWLKNRESRHQTDK